MFKISNKLYWWICFTIGSLLFLYVAYRSVILSITYDEVWTFELASQSIKDICSAQRNFHSANNHILNSILIKPCLYLFGHQVWVLRLPNVLAFILYFSSSVFAINSITKHNLLCILGVFVFNLHPFLLDFFSLSRGYGLANVFEMLSLAFLLYYWQHQQRRWMILSFAAAAFAVLSNFTWVNYIIPLWAVVNLMLFYKNKDEGKPIYFHFLQNNLPIVIILFFVACISFIPIQFLRQQDEFKWGANAWFDSFHTFAKDFNYHNSFTAAVILQIVLVLVFFAACFILVRNKHTVFSKLTALLFITSFISMIILASIVQRFLLHTMYMDGRKATLYFALVSILILSLLEHFYDTFPKLVHLKTMSLGLLACWHFSSFQKFHSVREWWFDEYDAEVTNYIVSHPMQHSSGVAVDWKFASSFEYYNTYFFQNKMQPLRSTRTGDYPNTTAYYYIFIDDISKVPSNYKEVKRFSFGGVLLSKK